MDGSVSEKSQTDLANGHTDYVNGDTEKADARLTDELEANPELDKRINRKFDFHVVPWLFGLWLLAFIDRANIGNAAVVGLEEQLKLKSTDFNIVLAVFYVPYICVDVPSNLVLKYFKAGYYLPALLIGWGLCSTFTGFVKSYEGLIAARFFLGLCEGGLLGGMILYLSMFYPRHAIMKRIGLFYCAAPLSGAFGGLLATGLSQIETSGYKGWPYIFVSLTTRGFSTVHRRLTVNISVHRRHNHRPIRHNRPFLPPSYSKRFQIPQRGRESVRSCPSSSRCPRRSKHRRQIREVLLGSGQESTAQRQHNSAVFHFLPAHHANLQLQSVPTNDYRSARIQRCSNPALNGSAEHLRLLHGIDCVLFERQDQETWDSHDRRDRHRYRRVYYAHRHSGCVDTIRWHILSRIWHLPLLAFGNGMAGEQSSTPLYSSDWDWVSDHDSEFRCFPGYFHLYQD